MSAEKCRLCLGAKARVRIFFHSRTLDEMIASLCGLVVRPDDGLPDRICKPCHALLVASYEFRARCIESDALLRRPAVKSEPEVKCEPLDEGCFEDDRDDNDEDYERGKESERTKIKRRRKRKQAVCAECGLCVTTSGLAKHARSHAHARDFACALCDKAYSSRDALAAHAVVHGEKKHSCDECGKLFFYRDTLKKHLANVHAPLDAERVACEICARTYKCDATLKVHLRKHTADDARAYQCDFCQRRFLTKKGIAGHMHVHTGDKPFECRFCALRFRAQRTVVDHERLHTGELPYECPACAKRFVQLSNLKSHFKNNHKGVAFYDVYKRKGKPRVHALDPALIRVS